MKINKAESLISELHITKTMENITEADAVSLLKKYAPDAKAFEIVLNHSRAVQAVAVRIANEIISNGHDVDMQFIRSASLLHDIGRFDYPPGKKGIEHGIKGAKILRKEGLDEKYALVCERHVGSGIDEKDIEEQKLPLPMKSYIPESVEEKIINYADSLIFGDKEGTIQQVIKRYRKEVNEKLAQRTVHLHNEIEQLRGKRGFLKISE